jgi:uncharacterized membrane protein YeaQ/YmgE (transglycosylase-associated protein family)
MVSGCIRALVAGVLLATPALALAQEDASPGEQPVVQTEMGAQVEQFLNEPVAVGGQTLAMTPGDIFTWVFVGVLAGTLAAMVFTRRESGFGHMANLGVGLLGALIGAALPLLLKRLGLDPAVSSTPFIASLSDVTGLGIYYLVASLLLL